MNAKDLMIGDWVLYKGKLIKIIGTDGSQNIIYYYNEEDYTEYPIDASNIEPILLTAEILEKNGFKERDPYFGNKEYTSDFHVMLRSWTNGESFNFHFYESTSGRDCWFPYPIQYVHELQHYFKDCKIEKEIEL